jgi:hypothetical protein
MRPLKALSLPVALVVPAIAVGAWLIGYRWNIIAALEQVGWGVVPTLAQQQTRSQDELGHLSQAQ